MSHSLSGSLVNDKEEKYLFTLSEMFSTVPLPEVLNCLRKHKGSMEDAVVELLSVSQQSKQSPAPQPPASLTTSTLGRVQQEISKAFEDQLMGTEAKIKEQAVEIGKLKGNIASKDTQIAHLQNQLNKQAEELEHLKRMQEARQIASELVCDVKQRIDDVFQNVKAKNVDPMTLHHVTTLVRQELAYVFLKDIQDEYKKEQAPDQLQQQAQQLQQQQLQQLQQQQQQNPSAPVPYYSQAASNFMQNNNNNNNSTYPYNYNPNSGFPASPATAPNFYPHNQPQQHPFHAIPSAPANN